MSETKDNSVKSNRPRIVVYLDDSSGAEQCKVLGMSSLDNVVPQHRVNKACNAARLAYRRHLDKLKQEDQFKKRKAAEAEQKKEEQKAEDAVSQ